MFQPGISLYESSSLDLPIFSNRKELLFLSTSFSFQKHDLSNVTESVASLESMYVTPNLSGVENEILGTAAQPLSSKIEILGITTQPLAWQEGCGAQRRKFLALRWHTSLRRKMCTRSMPQTLDC